MRGCLFCFIEANRMSGPVAGGPMIWGRFFTSRPGMV